MNTLHFTQVDLEANREGRLTDAQRKRQDADIDLLWQQGRYTLRFFAILCATRAVFDGIQAYNKAGQDISKLFYGENLTVLLIPLVVFITLASIVIPLNWWSIRVFARSPVHNVEGKVQVINTYKRFLWRRTPVYNVKIWRGWFWWMMFRFDDAESLTYFESGQRYRVYYLSNYGQPQALSAEEIEPEKAKG